MPAYAALDPVAVRQLAAEESDDKIAAIRKRSHRRAEAGAASNWRTEAEGRQGRGNHAQQPCTRELKVRSPC
jgi:hypothetical protein